MIGLALSIATAAMGIFGPVSDKPPPPQIAPARDGNIAIRQELDAARKAGTLSAYDLFIARHPSHPLAEIARKERQLLARQ
jgi:hypothetical protein